MTESTWTTVDHYLEGLLSAPDRGLAAAPAARDAAGLPAIQVSPLQGKQLMLLAKAQGARRILEVGTLGGYSAIWLARALPSDGTLITLELDPGHADVARSNLARAGLAAVSEVRVGPADASLATLVADGAEPFDFVFIDADKPGYSAYLRLVRQLVRPGSILVADNVVRQGGVADPSSSDPAVEGVQRFMELVAADPGLEATVVQTVGSKGYDGFLLAVVSPLTP